ncbi:hypothetical protein B0H14DRAFT_3540515 [Mycena olivaceomarginata]|nr:hypothetical protein B0H14DRAFT_3540515 [Mycena olivaceomarginata]
MHYLYPDSRRALHTGVSSSGTSLAINTPACEWHDRPGGVYNILGNVTGAALGRDRSRTFWPLALSAYSPPGGGFPLWGVTCKGHKGSLIDEYPIKKVINGDFLNAPIITGTNRNKGNYVIGTTSSISRLNHPLTSKNSLLSSFIVGQAANNETVSQASLAKLLTLYAHPMDDLLNRSPPVTSPSLQSQMQDFYISFVNDLNPEVFWLKYDEGSLVVLRLQEGNIGPIADTLQREQINQVDVLEEFGHFVLSGIYRY